MKFSTTIGSTLLLFLAATWLPAQRTPDEALRALQEGNQRFQSERSQLQPLGEGVRRTLARGQNPFAVVICCADSQVPPEHLFNTGLGELYVIRTAGHTIDAEAIAGLEHAVAELNVPLCVVLGHEGCAAVAQSVDQVQAKTQQRADSDHLQQLLEQIEPAVRKVRHRDLGGKELCSACEEEHAHGTVAECLRRSAVLRRFASVGKVKIVAARCHQASGEVEWLPIRPLPAEPEARSNIPLGAVPSGTPPHVALRMLQAGHRRFLGDGKPTADLGKARREALVEGQTPSVIVLTCADSRVVPEHIFDAGLGELFVIRTPGNVLTENALASIEQAAQRFGSSLLLVLGHERCDMVHAAADAPERQDLSPNMRALLQRIEPSVAKARATGAPREIESLATHLHAGRTLVEARSRSRLLRELENSGRFAMLASIYDVASGDITWLKEAAPAGEPTAAHVPAHGGGNASKPDSHGTHTSDTKSHAAHDAPAPHDLPVVDWDTPAAPAGEVAPPHGAHGDAHGSAGHDGAHGEPHGSTGHDDAHGEPHGSAGHDDAHAEPHGSTGHDDAHAEPHGSAGHDDAHGEPHGSTGHDDAHAEPHGSTGHDDAHGEPHGSAGHDDAHSEPHGSTGHDDAHSEPHGSTGHDDAHAAPGATKASVSWRDPIVLVGLTGVASLLAAALLALKR
ncbi:MAG: carbonic anhydrase [Planctomycetota bacterium]